MGNKFCFPIPKPPVKLILWEGTTRILSRKILAGEIMVQFPDRMVCHADSFFIGHPVPALSIQDHLIPGNTYFVLPLDCFTTNILSASSIAALGSSLNRSPPMTFKDCHFEYKQGSNGSVLIEVMPEVIASLITKGKGLREEESCTEVSSSYGFLCTTPELKKHYDELVGSKERVWSPMLGTIQSGRIDFRLYGGENGNRENLSGLSCTIHVIFHLGFSDCFLLRRLMIRH